MAEVQLNEIRVDPVTNMEEDTVSNRPGTSSQTNERSTWLGFIMRELEEAKTKQASGPMIPKVPDELKNMNKECYEPSVVSIGPYYYKDRQNKLHEMEKLKVRMARQFVRDSGKDIEILYSEFAKVAQDAKRFYQESSIGCFDDEQFTRMMFLDGCFILQFIHLVTFNNLVMNDQLILVGDQLILVKQDLLLLENQLPFPVLESLMSLRYEKDGKDYGMKIINDFLLLQTLQQSDRRRPVLALTWLVKGFLLLLLAYISIYPLFILPEQDADVVSLFISPLFGIFVAGVIVVCRMVISLIMRSQLFGKKRQAAKYPREPHQKPAHILELLYTMVVGSQKAKHRWSLGRCCCFCCCCCCYFLYVCLRKLLPKPKSRIHGHNLYYSANDLEKAGIHFKPNKTNTLMDVEFKSSTFSGTLSLPSIAIETSTRSMLLNLVAYETSAVLDQLWVTSYICFMDSLIDDAEDVKVLRSKGILTNYLGADHLVAHLFNQIGRSLKPNTNVYNDVKRNINNSCESIWKKWIAEWLQTYFISPWAFTAFVAAAAGLVLTATQTYYTVYPKK